MGIRALNRVLLENCGMKSIQKKRIRDFHSKTIVIDTSIYLYKFISENRLRENIARMCNCFISHNITPIFVFDGKPPAEKREMLYIRRTKKREAETKYNETLKTLDEINDQSEKKAVELQLDLLKRQFTRVNEADISAAKSIISSFGITIIDAVGESDCVCVHLVKTNKAWACLSDDMDMFVYGCPRVLRNLNLEMQSASLYTLTSILKDLKMTIDTFRDIAVISGTDYNIDNQTCLTKTLDLFYQYRRETRCDDSGNNIQFYDWLLEHTQYIQDYACLQKVRNMFDIANYPELTQYNNMDFSIKHIE
jgi:hypothetical protein